MRRRGQTGRRWVMIAVALGFAASGARGGENGDSESDDTIAGAKRDYEAITASKAGEEQQRIALPKQSLPNLELASPLVPAGHPPGSAYRKDGDAGREPAKQAKKSENWLVDAMAETVTGEGGDNANARDVLQSGETPVEGDLLVTAAVLEREEKAAEKVREARSPGASELTAENPLNAYMANWLSPHDLARLTPASISPAGGASDARFFPDRNGGVLTGAATPTSIFDRMDSSIRESEINAIVSHAPNPYLADSADLGRGPVAEFSPPLAAVTATPMTIVEPAEAHGPAPAAEANSQAPLSESLRTQDEAKYFRQLKRF